MNSRRVLVCLAQLAVISGCASQRFSAPPPNQQAAPVSAISARVADFKSQSDQITQAVAQDRQSLDDLRSQREQLSHSYYDQVSTIQAHLQAGTTPGNPELMATWQQAQTALAGLDDSVTKLSDLSAKITSDSAAASFLVSNVRAAFALQGALEADHAALADIQSEASGNEVVLDRLLADVADDVNRQTDALTNQHHSLPGLLSQIEAGQLLGPQAAEPAPTAEENAAAAAPLEAPAPPVAHHTAPPAEIQTGPRRTKPLLMVDTDQSPAQYEPKLYKLAAAAIKRSPNVSMNVVGVLPSGGPPTSRALATEAVRRKAEAVARALVSYGIARDHISISAQQGSSEMGGEVWVYTQ